MILKGLALGAAVAAIAVAIFVALTLPPARATITAPAGLAAPAADLVVLPNGVAAPQLRPAQPSAPTLVEADPSPVGLVRAGLDRAGSAALALRAELSAPATRTVAQQALHACGGN